MAEQSPTARRDSTRAQSHVVGVTLMLGLAVIALGTLTVAVGTVLDSQSANADASRVADDMDDVVDAVGRTGFHSHRLTFTAGTLKTTERTVRIIRHQSGSEYVVATYDVEALVFENGDRRVVGVAGAVLSGTEDNAWLVTKPRLTSSEGNDVLVVSLPVLNASNRSLGGQGGVTATVRTNVTHDRRELPNGTYAIAIETATPAPFEQYFQSQNATTERRTFSGDQFDSVVAHYPGDRDVYLVVHDLALEVNNG
jgi:hypothetical protein